MKNIIAAVITIEIIAITHPIDLALAENMAYQILDPLFMIMISLKLN
jgi:hypothetical protein